MSIRLVLLSAFFHDLHRARPWWQLLPLPPGENAVDPAPHGGCDLRIAPLLVVKRFSLLPVVPGPPAAWVDSDGGPFRLRTLCGLRRLLRLKMPAPLRRDGPPRMARDPRIVTGVVRKLCCPVSALRAPDFSHCLYSDQIPKFGQRAAFIAKSPYLW